MMGEIVAGDNPRLLWHLEWSHLQLLLSHAHARRHRWRKAHALLNHPVHRRELTRWIESWWRITKDRLDLIHQLVHNCRVLREKTQTPGQSTGGCLEAGNEKNRRLANQLRVGHGASLIIARFHEKREHIASRTGLSAPAGDHGEQRLFDLFCLA